MTFRPAPVPTIFVALALVILLNLGFWQLRRHGETQERLETIAARFERPALGNDDLGAPPAELAWQSAKVSGRFLERTFLVANRFEFGKPGYDVVQLFAVDDGPLLLVNRGWIPREAYPDAVATLPTEATVEGLVLEVSAFEPGSAFPPEGDAPERWAPNTYRGMAATLEPAPELVLVVGPALRAGDRKDPSTLPVTGFIPLPPHRDHLEYAGTWFLIAGTLLVLWGIAGVRRGARLGVSRAA